VVRFGESMFCSCYAIADDWAFSCVVAVEIDLGVASADVEAHCLVFVITLLVSHCLSLPPHCVSFMGIVFSSWLLFLFLF
jgi:hypothetical protein